MQASPKVLGVIPARMASRRFPGKPLAKILDKPMIRHVFERSSLCLEIDQILIATDSQEIQKEANAWGAHVCMTSSGHETGLDRLMEVKKTTDQYDLFVNIQGDEPLIHPETISGVIRLLKERPECEISSSAVAFQNFQDFQDENNVKVVLDKDGSALYFSRGPIPRQKEKNFSRQLAWKHLGLYAYKKEALDKIYDLPLSPLEAVENLEQLRILYHGLKIFIHKTEHDSIGVDHPEDIALVEEILGDG